MEITNEVKVKVFGQYLGHRVVTRMRGYDLEKKRTSTFKEGALIEVDLTHNQVGVLLDEEIVRENLINLDPEADCRLSLRPLSEITDEDAIMCYSIVDPRHSKPSDVEYWTHRHKPNSKRAAISIDIRRVDVPNECLNLGFEGASCVYYNDPGEANIERIERQIHVYQFLQSRGYDLPNYLLDGKTLHEAGLAIYENELK